MKKNIFIASFIFLYFFGYSQIDTKKVIVYNKTKVGEINKVRVSIKNAVSKFNFAKFKLVINNKSKDYILYKVEESKLNITSKEYSPAESRKPLIIRPKKKSGMTVKVTGGEEFLTEKYTFVPSGIYTFSIEGTPTEAPDFHMPANKNNFEVGDFEVNMIISEQKTKVTRVRFKCTYTGDKIGVVTPSNAVLKPEDGKEWANYRSRKKKKILLNGESCKFTLEYRIPGKIVDMQFAQMDILWKNTFAESELKKMDFPKVELTIDKAKTEKKNK